MAESRGMRSFFDGLGPNGSKLDQHALVVLQSDRPDFANFRARDSMLREQGYVATRLPSERVIVQSSVIHGGQ
jgi:hypothetical protein